MTTLKRLLVEPLLHLEQSTFRETGTRPIVRVAVHSHLLANLAHELDVDHTFGADYTSLGGGVHVGHDITFTSAAAHPGRCTTPPSGWTCSRPPHHPGPCAARRSLLDLDLDDIEARARGDNGALGDHEAFHDVVLALVADLRAARAAIAIASRRIDRHRELLEQLDHGGGLGYAVHERIRRVINDEPAPTPGWNPGNDKIG